MFFTVFVVFLYMKRTIDKAVLIYDDNCNLCRAGKTWIEKRALPGQIEFLSCQSLQRASRYPQVAKEQCMQAIQLVLTDSRILQGADAIPEILYRIKGWRWLEKLLRKKVFRRLAPKVYYWVAKNRQILSCILPKQTWT